MFQKNCLVFAKMGDCVKISIHATKPIECMFSDFKSRGFSITKTKLKHVDRIERLILVLTIALYWAVSTGMQPRSNQSNYTKKNSTAH